MSILATKSLGTLTVLRCIFGPNLVILTSIGGDLLFGQAQNGINFYFWVPFDLQGHGQLPHKTVGISTKVFYISGPSSNSSWVIKQTTSWLTDTRTHTHTGNDNTRRPKLAYWSLHSLPWIQFFLVLTTNWKIILPHIYVMIQSNHNYANCSGVKSTTASCF